MRATREQDIKCHACGQKTHTITVANAGYWAKVARMDVVSALGSKSDSRDTGCLRTANIGGQEYTFFEDEVQEHWPELARLFRREDLTP